MYKWLVWAICLTATQAVACVDTHTLQTLNTQEIQSLLQRIPPAFADAVDDGMVTSQLTLEDPENCMLRWQLTLPQADIDAARQLLAAQPAKQIMLAAQGYQLPQTVQQQARFQFDTSTGKPTAADVLQTGALGKLRASVELMYAMLTQARANQPITPPVAPWTTNQQTLANQQCQANTHETVDRCTCKLAAIAHTVPYRQWRYYQYLNSNPYAFASGQRDTIRTQEQAAKQRCQPSATTP